jgi:hypothetical protein
VVGWLEVAKDGVRLGAGKHDRDVPVAFGANNAVGFAEIPTQDVAEEEEEGVKGLGSDPFEVVRPTGGGHPGQVKPPLETNHQFCEKLPHRNASWPMALGTGRM